MYRKYKKTLPFGTTFLGTNIQSMELDSPLAPPLSEDEIQEKMRSITTQSKPNLYFFVLETLRKDCINEQIAPHLAAFGKENIDIQTSFANANGTHLSWFSIFYSEFPFHWTSIRDERNRGATSLQLLKQLGYKIRVYAALDLHYFEMDRVLFGDKRQLIDQIEEFSSDRTLEPCDRDALCINSFKRDLETEEGKDGNVYLFFLDSTHSEYSFPQNFPLKFTPSAKTIDYLTLSAKEVAPVINRYRNSISYLDGLMGDFFQILKQKELYETSIIAITGDHGEEFFEEGALFHGTHLNRYQTEVPIFFKCPGHTSWAEEATHIDMFPSLFHHLTKSSDFSLLFQGSSIFSQNRSPYRVSVMQNSADIPNELCIGKGKNKLHIRFLSSKDIYNQRQVEIITLDMPNELSNTPEDTLIQNYLKYLQ
jgi:hypothetical protein